MITLIKIFLLLNEILIINEYDFICLNLYLVYYSHGRELLRFHNGVEVKMEMKCKANKRGRHNEVTEVKNRKMFKEAV